MRNPTTIACLAGLLAFAAPAFAAPDAAGDAGAGDGAALRRAVDRLRTAFGARYPRAGAGIAGGLLNARMAGGALPVNFTRADMPGYEPCEADRVQLDRWAARQADTARRRQAMREGRRTYDEP